MRLQKAHRVKRFFFIHLRVPIRSAICDNQSVVSSKFYDRLKWKNSAFLLSLPKCRSFNSIFMHISLPKPKDWRLPGFGNIQISAEHILFDRKPSPKHSTWCLKINFFVFFDTDFPAKHLIHDSNNKKFMKIYCKSLSWNLLNPDRYALESYRRKSKVDLKNSKLTNDLACQTDIWVLYPTSSIAVTWIDFPALVGKPNGVRNDVDIIRGASIEPLGPSNARRDLLSQTSLKM